jgi:hypothetical protein
VEVRFGNYTEYIHGTGINPNISAIVSRYNATKNYITGYSDSSPVDVYAPRRQHQHPAH